MAKQIQVFDTEAVRLFTSAKNSKNGNFRFFRYSQDKSHEEDRGNVGGKNIRISGEQFQFIAKGLCDFFGYTIAEVGYNEKLNSLKSIETSLYKSSPFSDVLGKIQDGDGKGALGDPSSRLKLSIIKRYRPKFAKNKPDEVLLRASLDLEDIASEQIGVIGPVTYNFLSRQIIYKWFDDTYLANPNSFLSTSLPRLGTTTYTQQAVDPAIGYYTFVDNKGGPENKPYPVVGVLFDLTESQTDDQLFDRASKIIDFILLKDTTPLIKDKIYKIKRKKKDNQNEPERVCIYVDLAEALFCKTKTVGTEIIDMIKAGISFLHVYKREFLSNGTITSINSAKSSIVIPTSKFLELQDKIDETVFNFLKPKEILDDAVYFKITNDTDTVYNDPYDITTVDLLGTHDKHTNNIIDRAVSERTIRKNIALRNYPSAPFDEKLQFYYDANYNLLACSFTRNPAKANIKEPSEDVKLCITEVNNVNLKIGGSQVLQDILDMLSGKDETYKYISLNDKIPLFITEFFIKKFSEVYDKIKNDIIKDINKPDVTKTIPNKDAVFLENNFSRLSEEYLFCYSKETLFSNALDKSAALQFVKLKSSNFWTTVFENLANRPKDFDTFLTYHYPELKHEPGKEKPPPPTATLPPREDRKKPPGKRTTDKESAPPVKFERLSSNLLRIPNTIDLSTELKIDDLLTGDCFAALLSIINRKIPINFIDSFNIVYNIINSLDLCNLVNSALSLAIQSVNKIDNFLREKLLLNDSYTTPDQLLPFLQEFTEINNGVEEAKKLLCPLPPQLKLASDKTPKDELLRDLCEFALFNIGAIPYVLSADFLKALKETLLETFFQIIMQIIFDLLNAVIEEINKLCVDKDVTNEPSAAKRRRPRLRSPSDALDDLAGKCNIVGLLSSNTNIARFQIYNVVRVIFKIKQVTNAQFDSYFSALTTTLSSQGIINLFSDAVDNNQYLAMKTLTSQKEYSNFSFLFSNRAIFNSFFNFLARYVDLTPCYELLAQDDTQSEYCFIPKVEEAILPEELLGQANDLLKQVAELCTLQNPDSIRKSIEGAALKATSLNPEGRSLVSLSTHLTIEGYKKTFEQVKKQFINSYTSIFLLNRTINQAIKTNNFGFAGFNASTNPLDVISPIIFDSSFTELSKNYVFSKLKNFESNDEESSIKTLLVQFISEGLGNNSEDIKFGSEYSINDSETKKQIIPSSDTLIKKLETSLVSTPSVETYDKQDPAEDIINIFFDSSRFQKGLEDPKNYYFIYDNLLPSSEKNTTAEVESLKRYKDVRTELENFLKNINIGG